MPPRTHLQEDFAVRRQSPVFAKFMPFLCHPGFTRLKCIFCILKTYPFLQVNVKFASQAAFCGNQTILLQITKGHLIKSSKLLKQISLDFKGRQSSLSCNKYLLVIIVKYSRFWFVFPCPTCIPQL